MNRGCYFCGEHVPSGPARSVCEVEVTSNERGEVRRAPGLAGDSTLACFQVGACLDRASRGALERPQTPFQVALRERLIAFAGAVRVA